MIPRERGLQLQAKEEGDPNEGKLVSKASGSSSRQWSAFRNPRIVRVSRSFGGKDRHSKVCTVRGLRDRRIRLSVPTAIQLYDLQDKLGLSQPSKVIDWLLDATKHDIDKLPPLQIPQGLGPFHQQLLLAHGSGVSQQPSFGDTPALVQGININSRVCEEPDEDDTMGKARFWDKGKWVRGEEQNHVGGGCSYGGGQVSAQNFFPVSQPSSLPSFPNYWEHPNLSLTQALLSQNENNNSNNNPLNPTSMPFPSGSQFLFYPPVTAPPFFPYPPYVAAATPVDANHFQSQDEPPNSLTIGSSLMPFSLNVHSRLANTETHPRKESS